MDKDLERIAQLLTCQLKAAINIRNKAIGKTKTRYRKLAKHLEQSLKSLDNAINLIGE